MSCFWPPQADDMQHNLAAHSKIQRYVDPLRLYPTLRRLFLLPNSTNNSLSMSAGESSGSGLDGNLITTLISFSWV